MVGVLGPLDVSHPTALADATLGGLGHVRGRFERMSRSLAPAVFIQVFGIVVHPQVESLRPAFVVHKDPVPVHLDNYS